MRLVQLVAAAALVCACGKESSAPPPSTAARSVEQLSAPPRTTEVPANTAFRVTIDDTLSSAVSYPGQTFTATLKSPLVSSDFRVAAPAGSKVHGHVIAVDSGREPRVAVAFDSIVSPMGSYRIEAHANEALNAPFEIASARSAEEANADSVFRPSDRAIGGGPPPEDLDEEPTTMVVIPKNSELELVLTSPMTASLVP